MPSAITGIISLLLREKVARFTATDEVLLQYIAETNPISPCSHPYFCQKLNREVRHSPTWHSSESESALERFEPVAVVQQLPDGRGSVFAPEGDGCLQRAKREDAGRFSKEGKSLDDFWYFSSLKSTIKEKFL